MTVRVPQPATDIIRRAALCLALSLLAACETTPADVPPSTSETERPRYDPFRAFFEIPCEQASAMVVWDLRRAQQQHYRDAVGDYVFAFGNRYAECSRSDAYVADYLGVLERAGWSGRYNELRREHVRQFPGSAVPAPLPDSAGVRPAP